MEKCNGKLYNNINKKQISLLPPKAGGCLKIICQKLINCCWEFGDQIRPNVSRAEAEKTSVLNHQSRVEVGQTRNWNSVFQSAGCNANATNRTCFETKINMNKKAGTENACRPNSSTGVLRANIKQWTIVQKKHWC
jgi:hypothetical protein